MAGFRVNNGDKTGKNILPPPYCYKKAAKIGFFRGTAVPFFIGENCIKSAFFDVKKLFETGFSGQYRQKWAENSILRAIKRAVSVGENCLKQAIRAVIGWSRRRSIDIKTGFRLKKWYMVITLLCIKHTLFAKYPSLHHYSLKVFSKPLPTAAAAISALYMNINTLYQGGSGLAASYIKEWGL